MLSDVVGDADWFDLVVQRMRWMEVPPGVLDLGTTKTLEGFIQPPANIDAKHLGSMLTDWWVHHNGPTLVLLNLLVERSEIPGVWAEALLRRLDWWDDEALPMVFAVVARDLDKMAEPRLAAWAGTLPGVRRRLGHAVARRLASDPYPPLGTIAGLQARLNDLEWADLEVTGTLDPPTREVVWCVQQQLDRQDADVVDSLTFEAFRLPEEYED